MCGKGTCTPGNSCEAPLWQQSCAAHEEIPFLYRASPAEVRVKQWEARRWTRLMSKVDDSHLDEVPCPFSDGRVNAVSLDHDIIGTGHHPHMELPSPGGREVGNRAILLLSHVPQSSAALRLSDVIDSSQAGS